MNGAELAAVRSLRHLGIQDATLWYDRYPASQWGNLEANPKPVPSGLDAVMFDRCSRFTAFVETMPPTASSQAVEIELDHVRKKVAEGKHDQRFDGRQWTVFNCLSQAALGSDLPDQSIILERTGRNLRRMRKSLFLTPPETATGVATVPASQWVVGEEGSGDGIPEPVWERFQTLGAMRQTWMLETYDGIRSRPILATVKNACSVWFEFLADFQKVSRAKAERTHLRALQSAQAELIARLQDRFRTVAYDAKKGVMATSACEGDGFAAWLKPAANRENEADRVRRRAERALCGEACPTVH